eukprot:1185827-Prorocentrum_minimum.AAC.3
MVCLGEANRDAGMSALVSSDDRRVPSPRNGDAFRTGSRSGLHRHTAPQPGHLERIYVDGTRDGSKLAARRGLAHTIHTIGIPVEEPQGETGDDIGGRTNSRTRRQSMPAPHRSPRLSGTWPRNSLTRFERSVEPEKLISGDIVARFGWVTLHRHKPRSQHRVRPTSLPSNNYRSRGSTLVHDFNTGVRGYRIGRDRKR